MKSTPRTTDLDDYPEEGEALTQQQKVKKVKLSHFKDGTDKWLMVGAAFGNLLSGGVYPLFLWLFGKMTDAAGTSDRTKWFTYMFIVAACDFGVAFVGCACAEVSAERQQRRMRWEFLKKIMEQEMGYFDAFDATTLATKMGFNCVQVRSAIGQKSGNFILHMGFVWAALGFAFWLSWDITLVALTTVPFVIGAGIYATYVEVQSTIRTKKSFEEASSIAQEAFGAVKTIKAFSMEPVANGRFDKAADVTFETAKSGGLKVGLATGAHWFMMFVSIGVAYIYATQALIKSRERGCTLWGLEEPLGGCLSAGDAITAFWCVVGMGFFLGKAGPIFSARRKARVAMADIVELYSRETQINPYAEGGIKDVKLEGRIEFRGVKFAYPTRTDRPIFRNLSLTLDAGKSTALVGSSGCGKSTVIQLIERFYDVDGGQVLIDGRDIREYNIHWLRDQIALVSQEPRLFADTVYANIAIGRPNATREQIIQAAKEANAHDFITKFPKGYDTHVGEGGGQLSGGQKQRIAIARAILRDPKILILDEATSALDNESEKIVQETLNEVVAKGQRTTIIIAHRLSTIRQSDCICVLDNPTGEGAELAERGSHEELVLIPDGLYAALTSAQIDGDGPGGLLGGDEAAIDDDQRRNLLASAELASLYSSDLNIRQASVIKLRSKFSSISKASYGELPLTARPAAATTSPSRQRRQYRRTVEPLKMHYWRVALCLLGAVVNGLIWPIFAVCWSYIVEVFIQPDVKDMRSKWGTWVGPLFSLGVAAWIGLFLQTSMVEFCGGIIVRAIRKRCFRAVLQQDVEFFDVPEHSTGSLLALVSTDAVRLQKWGGDNLAVTVQSLTGVVLGLILAMMADWRLGLVALGSVLVVVPVTYLQSTLQRTGGFQPKPQEELQQQQLMVTGGDGDGDGEMKTIESQHRDTQQVLTESILNIRTVTAYNMQSAMSERYQSIVQSEYMDGRRRALLSGVCWGLGQCLILFIIAGNFYFGTWLIENDTNQSLDVRRMFQAIFCLILAALNVGKALTSATGNAQARDAATRVYSVIDNRPVINDSSLEGVIIKPSSSIEEIKFENVKFHYPRRPDVQIYRSINFDVKRGQSVALVGASGCGKSTCVQLIERFYDNTDGTIYLNGHDLHTYNIQSLRQRIGLVSQEPVLFYGTIEENIANGKPNCTMEEIIRAAKLANAHDFISKLPEQYNTEVGRGGSKLSGGQKQRIAVARALIREPSLLILDEATSALDTESEKIVQEALNNLLATKQYTSIVIAHRLSTVRSCDKIVVFVNPDGHGAKIAEVGTHDELIKLPNGIYRGLVNIAARQRDE